MIRTSIGHLLSPPWSAGGLTEGQEDGEAAVRMSRGSRVQRAPAIMIDTTSVDIVTIHYEYKSSRSIYFQSIHSSCYTMMSMNEWRKLLFRVILTYHDKSKSRKRLKVNPEHT